MSYPLEARLRPDYELCSAAVAAVCGIAVSVTPQTFLLPKGVSWAMGVAFLVLAALRTNFPETGLEVLGYGQIAALARAGGLVDAVRSIEARALARASSQCPKLISVMIAAASMK